MARYLVIRKFNKGLKRYTFITLHFYNGKIVSYQEAAKGFSLLPTGKKILQQMKSQPANLQKKQCGGVYF